MQMSSASVYEVVDYNNYSMPLPNQQNNETNEIEDHQVGKKIDNNKRLYKNKQKSSSIVDHINQLMEQSNTNLRFIRHEQLGEYYVQIVDSKTDEVVKEIPSKKMLDSYAIMKEFIGVLFDQKI